MSQQMFEHIIEINKRLPSGVQHAVPALIGTTGIGKTTRLRKYAEEHDMEVRTLLLGTMMEEDVMGLPYIKDGVSHTAIPEWAVGDKPFLLFLDELDKARPSVISTVLTVMAEHRIRDHVLPKGTIIVAAMQPVSPSEFLADQTGQAFSARCVYIDLKADWRYLANKYSVKLDFMPTPEAHNSPILTTPSPRQIEWAINAIEQCLGEGENGEDKAKAILAGALQPQLIDPLIQSVKDNYQLAPEDMVHALQKSPELIAKVSIPEMIALMPDIWMHSDADTLCASWKHMLLNGTNEEIEACLASQYDKLLDVATANGGKVKVLGDTTEEEDKAIAEQFNEMLAEVGVIWLERRDAAEAEKANTEDSSTESEEA